MTLQLISVIPDEIFLKIFSYLSVQDLTRAHGVCKLWRRITSDRVLMPLKIYLQIKHRQLPITVFDPNCWKKYVDLDKFGLSVDDANDLDREMTVEKIHDLIHFVALEGCSGGSLLLKPKGLSISTILEAASHPKVGPLFPLPGYTKDFLTKLESPPTQKSSWIWISQNIVDGSRRHCSEKQIQLLARVGCEMPSVLDVITYAFARFMITEGNERIFEWDRRMSSHINIKNGKQLTYTRCKDQVEGQWHIVLGEFSSSGLKVGHFFDLKRPCLGVLAIQHL